MLLSINESFVSCRTTASNIRGGRDAAGPIRQLPSVIFQFRQEFQCAAKEMTPSKIRTYILIGVENRGRSSCRRLLGSRTDQRMSAYRPSRSRIPAPIARMAMRISSPEWLKCNRGISPIKMSQIPNKIMPRFLGSFIGSFLSVNDSRLSDGKRRMARCRLTYEVLSSMPQAETETNERVLRAWWIKPD